LRNRLDGSVEACVDGDAHDVDTIIAWARRGPPAAQISNVIVEDSSERASTGGAFKILPTN